MGPFEWVAADTLERELEGMAFEIINISDFPEDDYCYLDVRLQSGKLYSVVYAYPSEHPVSDITVPSQGWIFRDGMLLNRL